MNYFNSKVLIISDRFPSAAGAGAESVLSALCNITAGQGTLVDFLVFESPLIRVNFERIPTGYGHNLAFLRAVELRESGHEVSVSRLPDGQAGRLDLSNYRKIFVFGDDNIVQFGQLAGHKVAWPDDPPHLVSNFKASCSLLPPSSRLRSYLYSIKQRWKQRVLLRALRTYELIVHHAYHHAEEFRKATNRPVLYAPPLIPSMLLPAQANWPGLVPSPRKGFIHIGHLGGAASLASIEMMLSTQMLGYVDGCMEPIALIGKADIPSALKARLEFASYKLMGFVEDLDAAMRSCRAVVVPGDYAVGARTRILHSLSLGTPVIAHTSCLNGIPELKNCKAVFLFDCPDDLITTLQKLNKTEHLEQSLLNLAAIEFMSKLAPQVKQKWADIFL
jgi:hypothetical protein